SIQHAIEEDGILSSERGDAKLAAVFDMDQTDVYIDMAGNTTIDFVGNATMDVQQGPGGPVSHQIWSPVFGSPGAEHTVQKKAFCNEAVMMEWIERV
ncbi:hypothetical protein PHYSODRAFT_382259, partial [Phytophthora sojae]